MLVRILVVALPLVGAWLHQCPPTEDMYPQCRCQEDDEVVSVKCNGLDSAHLLSEVLTGLRNYVLDSLTLQASGPLEMAAGPFAKLNVHRLLFVNTSFVRLPLLSSLKGLENSLEEVTINGCNVSRWIWVEGRNFHFLKKVDFRHTALPSTLNNRTFSLFPVRIEELWMVDCGLKELQKGALGRFSFLKLLSLEDNKLTHLARNSLASNLLKLSRLILRGNPLTLLPADAFVRMPRLEFLYLGQTKLSALSRKTFQPVWDQLKAVYFNNVLLNCDCQSAWLIRVDIRKMPKPPLCRNLKGKSIHNTTHTELCTVRR